MGKFESVRKRSVEKFYQRSSGRLSDAGHKEINERRNKNMNLNPVKIIAVDFDGTLCMNRYPEIGDPMYGTIAYLFERKRAGR